MVGPFEIPPLDKPRQVVLDPFGNARAVTDCDGGLAGDTLGECGKGSSVGFVKLSDLEYGMASSGFAARQGRR